MRWSTREQHQEYRNITRYLSALPRYVADNPRIRNAFLRYSGFSGQEMDSVITLGRRPLFQVAPIVVPGAPGASANGSYDTSTGLITIDLVVAAEVEHQRSLREELAKKLLYAVCLHELVHHGRLVKQLPSKVNDHEAGKMFECEAYQGDVGWDGQSSVLRTRRSGVYNGVAWACPLSTLAPRRTP